MQKNIGLSKGTSLHLYPGYMGLTCKLRVLEVDETDGTQRILSLVSLLLEKFDEIFGKEVSTLNCPLDSLIANLPLHLDNLVCIPLKL